MAFGGQSRNYEAKNSQEENQLTKLLFFKATLLNVISSHYNYNYIYTFISTFFSNETKELKSKETKWIRSISGKQHGQCKQ